MIAEYMQTSIGRIPREWEIVKLKEITETVKGKRPKILFDEKAESCLPYLTAEYMRTNSNVKWCKEDDPNVVKVDKDDVIIIWDGSHSGDVFIGFEGALASTMVKLGTTENIHNKFLYYFLTTKFRFLRGTTSGTGIPHVTKDVFENMVIPIPSVSEQKKIAEVLTSVDDSIEGVDEAIAKTERLKIGLTQKLLKEGIRHEDFKETKIGKIPRNWKVVSLKDIATIERGKFAHRPRNDPRFYGGEVPFVQTGDIAKANGIMKKYFQTLNEEGLRISKLFKKGTIVISIAGNIGDVGILGFDACFPDSIVGISVRDNVNRLFLMYLLESFKHELSAKAPRGTQKNINLRILEPFKIPLPPPLEQEKIAKILSTADYKLELDRKRKVKLERIKKGLMNDLLTGKRGVKVAM